MTLPHGDAHLRSANDPVLDWLLDADPAIRWQVLSDLTETPAEIVAAERSRVASEGWGPRLLDQQRPDGQWGDGVATPFWWSNLYTLLFLRDLGLDPASERARTAIDLVRDNVTWGPEFGDSPFFEGEVEPCINGRVVALGAYFGERSDRLVDRLLHEQLADGGWNCEAERGSVRSSFHTAICVLEGLLAFEKAFGATSAVSDARRRGEEYLLDRRLLRRLSTGEIIDPTWTQFAFPTLWHYDVLRALDCLRAAGVEPDARVEEAVAIVLDRRQDSGRWRLDVRHRNTLHEELAGAVGEPNRWNTLRARRVLDWYSRGLNGGPPSPHGYTWRMSMRAEQHLITGNEDLEGLSDTHRVLAEFYAAFNGWDLEAMARNWADTGEVVMDNPLGGVVRGWPEIRAVYEKIFAGPGSVTVELYDYTLHEAGELFYVVGRERGELRTDAMVLELAIRTTRIFRRIGGRWRQVHHHGSFDDPDVLARYREGVGTGAQSAPSN